MQAQTIPAGAVTPVILTRPKAQAERFGGDLKSAFGARIEVIVSPVLNIEPVLEARDRAVLRRDYDVIFTSERSLIHI